MKRTSVILGAGYSYVAGLPLAKDLLSGDVYVPSHGAAERWGRVVRHFAAWKAEQPDGYSEQYLRQLYEARSWGQEAVLWLAAVELIAATLATPRVDLVTRSPRYTSLLSRSYRCTAHRQFWDVVLARSSVGGVVTLNYDLLAERSLRHRPMLVGLAVITVAWRYHKWPAEPRTRTDPPGIRYRLN